MWIDSSGSPTSACSGIASKDTVLAWVASCMIESKVADSVGAFLKTVLERVIRLVIDKRELSEF